SVVYAFFHAEPDIEFGKDNTADYVVYRCINCGEKVRQGMKTGDRENSPVMKGNLREHVKKCWGQEALDAVSDTTLEKARAAVRESKKKKQTTLTVVVSTVQSWFKSFSTRPPEREKIRVVTARWVAESARPFLIVQDRGYRWLQKEGRPKHYVPNNDMVSRDVKKLYAASKIQLRNELQEYEYLIPVELDCWTSPNH
ncbi:hypothetical protein F5878DRAFT_499240, partial [Lentinula raphanica]